MKMFEYDGNYLRGWRDELLFWDFIKQLSLDITIYLFICHLYLYEIKGVLRPVW